MISLAVQAVLAAEDSADSEVAVSEVEVPAEAGDN
jgi:hypothetical protein